MASSGPDGCAYSCRHPLWGGNGICSEDDEHAQAVCSCDATYSTRDAFGRASCVPTRALLVGYLFMAVVSMVCASVLLRDANRYWFLSEAARRSRKIAIRFKILLCASVFVVGHVFLGVTLAVQAGKKGFSFHDTGFIQVLYIVLLPAMIFGVAMIADFWVESLPYQVIAPGTFAASLRSASRKHGAFVAAGALNAGTVSVLGVLTVFVPPVWPPLLADIALAAGAASTCAVVFFVSVGITSFVNSPAILKRSAQARTVYLETKKNVWLETTAVLSVGCVMIAAIVAQRLTLAGQNTPIISWTFQVVIGDMATVVFAKATEFRSLPPPSFSARAGPQPPVSIDGARDSQAPKGARRTFLALSGGGSSAFMGSMLDLKRLPSLRFVSGEWMHRHHFEQMQRHQNHHHPQEETQGKLHHPDHHHQQGQEKRHQKEETAEGREGSGPNETISVQTMESDSCETRGHSQTPWKVGPTTAKMARVVPTETETVVVSENKREGEGLLDLSVDDIEQDEQL